jgi:hypothetical protein
MITFNYGRSTASITEFDHKCGVLPSEKLVMLSASDAEVIALLKRYKCPTPFHEVILAINGRQVRIGIAAPRDDSRAPRRGPGADQGRERGGGARHR